MGKIVKKRAFFYFLLALFFLAVIPSTAFYAQGAGAAGQSGSSGCTERDFGEGATVDSVTREIKAFNPEIIVRVTDRNGTPRTEGLLLEGDFVTLFDRDGNLLNRFVNVSSSGGSPSGPESLPSSDPPLPSSNPPQGSSEPAQNSSEPAQQAGSSEGGASAPVTSSPASSEVFPPDGSFYEFDGPVTVEQMETRLVREGIPDSSLTVQSKTGSVRESGPVCTGDLLTVKNPDGTLQNRVTAVIPGDLTRCGRPTEQGSRLLYDYLNDCGTFSADLRRAADLDGDGAITTSDLLELKKMISGDTED